jgi:acyl-CoA hydrolase
MDHLSGWYLFKITLTNRKSNYINISMSDQKQSKATLKALRAEAKKTGVKNYSKLSRNFLIEAIEKQAEQNNISEAVKIVFDTTAPEAQGEPEPVPPVPTIPPPSTPEKKKSLSDCMQSKSNKTRKKKDTKSNDPDCSLTVVHIDKPTETDPEAPAPAPAPKKKGPNKWQLHVQAFRSEHPELSYKQAMIDAKTTYQA